MDFIEVFKIKQLPRYVFYKFVEAKYDLIDLNLGAYWFWAGLRVLSTILPQTGYIHPDEYFQTVEVLAGNAFGIESNVPWEFNATSPLRSIPAIYLTMYIPMCILRMFSSCFEFIPGFSLTTHYLVLVTPRLSMCLLSFLSDICLFNICYSFGQNYRQRLIMFASSFISLVYMTRTLTNSIEMLCFNVLLCLVALCIADTETSSFKNNFLSEKYNEASTAADQVRIKKLLKVIPKHKLSRCIPIAIVTVTGVFNRPTFLLFAITPLFFWFYRGLNMKSSFLVDFHIRMFIFILYCTPIIAFFILCDSAYYGYITWGEVLNFDIGFKNFVLTPYNFIKYNLDTGNLSMHGLHPRFLHILVNIPLLFNVLGLSGLIVVLKLIYRGTFSNWTLLPKSQSVTSMMTLSFVIPVLGLSILPHQEARFIIPVLLPLIFLYSHLVCDFEEEYLTIQPFRKRYPKHIYVPDSGVLRYPLKCLAYFEAATEDIDNRYNISGRYLSELQHQEVIASMDIPPRRTQLETKSDEEKKPKTSNNCYLLKAWYTINIVCFLFYGFVHQGGMYGLTREFRYELMTKPRYTTYHLITSHVYSFPVHLLTTAKMTRQTKNSNFVIYEMGSAKFEEFQAKLKRILKLAEATKKSARRNYKVFVALPTSVYNKYITDPPERPKNYTYEIVKSFYPHLSTEAFPDFSLARFPCHFCDSVKYSRQLNFPPFNYVCTFFHHLTLVVVEIKYFEQPTSPPIW